MKVREGESRTQVEHREQREGVGKTFVLRPWSEILRLPVVLWTMLSLGSGGDKFIGN